MRYGREGNGYNLKHGLKKPGFINQKYTTCLNLSYSSWTLRKLFCTQSWTNSWTKLRGTQKPRTYKRSAATWQRPFKMYWPLTKETSIRCTTRPPWSHIKKLFAASSCFQKSVCPKLYLRKFNSIHGSQQNQVFFQNHFWLLTSIQSGSFRVSGICTCRYRWESNWSCELYFSKQPLISKHLWKGSQSCQRCHDDGKVHWILQW